MTLVAAYRHAAVDNDLRARDEARLVGGEKERRACGVGAVTHEAERYAPLALAQQRFDVAAGALPGETRLDHRRVELAGHDDVRPDVPRGVLHGDDTRELDDGRLGRGVGDLGSAGPAQTGR